MSDYRYKLEPYNGQKTRYHCPRCNVKNSFTRFIDTYTNEYLGEDVGICNRKNKCGYQYLAKDFFKDNKNYDPSNKTNLKPKVNHNFKKKQKSTYDIISHHHIKRSRINRYDSYFYDHFIRLFGTGLGEIFELYKIGGFSNKKIKRGIVFWQIDLNGKCRTGKVMRYDVDTGKKVGIPLWFHKLISKKDFSLKQVPFGLHLLNKFPNKKIAVVESEKSALLMAIAQPEFNWIAVGSCQNLSPNMFESIKNKDVILFPDAGKYELWSSKIKKLPTSNFYSIFDLLHKTGTQYEKDEDYDIADYYLRILEEEQT